MRARAGSGWYGYRYKLFSLNTTEEMAAFDQAGEILRNAGGIPYKLTLPWPGHLEEPVCIGLDLGHPRNTPESWASVSLVSHEGLLLGVTRFRQDRDETIRSETLAQCLDWALREIRKHGYNHPELLVFRDGPSPKNERLDLYTSRLGDRMTLAEIIKRPVPLMVEGTDAAAPGTATLPVDGEMPFVQTCGSYDPNHIPVPSKICIIKDGLELGLDHALKIATGLCHAPSLGLRCTGSPSPIYWADGYASVGPLNRQFAGLGFDLQAD